jgi:hypothetical protein
MSSTIFTFLTLLLATTPILTAPVKVSNAKHNPVIAVPDIANNNASNAIDNDGPKAFFACQDGDTTCANGYTAVAYCDKGGWWVREFCGREQKCNWEPYPFCVNKY